MATSYGATARATNATDVEQDASKIVVQPGARSGRWLSLSVIALVVTSCVLLVVRSTSPSSMASTSKLSPLAFHHKTTTEDEETAVDTAVWTNFGSWEQNGLGSEINYNYLSGGSATYNALGGTNDLSRLYVTDTDGYLKVSTNGGSSFTTTRPFTYTYGGSYKGLDIAQVAVAGSSGSIAYVSTKYSANGVGGYSPGKIFKTSDSGASWTEISMYTSSDGISYAGVATSSTGQYVLTIENNALYRAYVSKDYGKTFYTSYTLSSSYPFRACAVSASGQYMYVVSDNYLYISKSYGTSGSWGNTYYFGITASWENANKISVSYTGDKIVIVGRDVLYSSNYGATLTKLSPTDTTNSCSMVYKIIDAQISPDGATVAVIQSGSPAVGSGNNEAYIRYTTDAASGASATWSTLYPSSLGNYNNNWFITAFRLNTAGTYIVTVSPTTSYVDSSYRQKWNNGNGWHGGFSKVPTAAPTFIPPTMKPTPVPTHTPRPSAKPTLAPTSKPNSTPAPTGGQVSEVSLTGKMLDYYTPGGGNFPIWYEIDYQSIASTTTNRVVYAAFKARDYFSTGNVFERKPAKYIYGSSGYGSEYWFTLKMGSTKVGCDSDSAVVSGLEAAAYSSTMDVVWFTCGPYEISSGGQTKTYMDFKVFTSSLNVYSRPYTVSVTSYRSTSTTALGSAFATVGASAVSSDGLKYAIAGQEGGLVLLSVTKESGGLSEIKTIIHDFGSTAVGNNRYGGLAWSSDGAYLLVAPSNGLNLWYFTVPSTCFSTATCTLDSLKKTTSPSLPASTGGSTGTWTSCVAQTDNNYMACTQYGGYTYYSTNKGVSWSKVGTQATFISKLAMYPTTSGKACLAGISTYGSPHLMTNTDGQSTTEWVAQTVGDSTFGKGFYDVTLQSCSFIYATLARLGASNNILALAGALTEADPTNTTYTLTEADSSNTTYTDDIFFANTTDYNWTWGTLTSSSETAYSAIAASSDGIYVYAAFTNSTIGVSSDGGDSWTTASGPGTADWTDISCSSNGQYVTVVSSAGDIWSSTDTGATWTSEILVEQDTLISVAVSGDGSTVFLGGNNGAYLSVDSGAGYFTIQTSNYINSSSTYGFNVAASSDGAVLIAASTFGGVLSSNDTGETWAFYYTTNQTFSSVKYANGVVYAASTQDGLYSSTDFGATWTMFDAAPQDEEWKTIAVSPDGTFIAAAASYEFISVSDDGGATWGTIGEGDIWTDLVFVSDGKVLLATSEGKNSIDQAVYSDPSSSSKNKKSSSSDSSSDSKESKKSSSKKSSSKKSSSKKSSSKKSSSKKSSGK